MIKCYCGPNVIKYNLMRYQVFVGEDYPYNVKEAINEVPEIERLFCEPEELESMRAKIQDIGTAENLYYAKVEDFVKEYRKKQKESKKQS